MPLTPKAIDILILLVHNSGQILEKQKIMDQIWPDSYIEEATLAQNIFTLRKALGESLSGTRYIETIPKRGYRFTANVHISYGDISSVPENGGSIMPSIAILPFDFLHAINDNQYLGLGLADALITKLSNIKQIIVRPTRSVRRYSSLNVDPVVAGKELDVDLVLAGNILQVDDKIRVTVQLVTVADSTTSWSDKFDATFDDIFTVQDCVSQQIINALTLKLTVQEKEHVIKNYTNNSEAYLDYLKGRYYWGKWTPEGFKKAISCFQQAIEKDPYFALAQAALAEAYNTLSFYGYIEPKTAFRIINRAALQALQLDPMLAEAHAAMAINNFAYTWDWATAEQEFLRAIEINSGNPILYHLHASFLIAMSRFEEANAQMMIAQRLDPLSPLIGASIAYPMYFSRQYEQAVKALMIAIDMDAYFPLSHKILADAYVEMGLYQEAISEYVKAIELLGRHHVPLAYLGRAYALSGRPREAVKIINELETRSQETYVSPTSIAIIQLGLGEKDHAIRLLEEAYRERCNSLVFINVHPAFDAIRETPEFANLIHRMGLAPA